MERCPGCGTQYDPEEEEYCPKCGAENIETYKQDFISDSDLDLIEQ